ncbi:MAG: hypothetical protein WAV41_03355 [Microgenomates group bacterium]
MAEKHPNLWERLKTNVKSGWERFMAHTSAGRIAEETIAEVHGVGGMIVEKAKEKFQDAKEFISDAYHEGSNKNVFERIGNVFKRGYEVMSEKFKTLKENVGGAVEELKERYRGLGIINGSTAMVEDATAAVGVAVNFLRHNVEQIKLGNVIDRANDLADKGVEQNRPRLEVMTETIEHMSVRSEYFIEKARELNNRLNNMAESREKLKIAKGAHSLTFGTATA